MSPHVSKCSEDDACSALNRYCNSWQRKSAKKETRLNIIWLAILNRDGTIKKQLKVITWDPLKERSNFMFQKQSPQTCNFIKKETLTQVFSCEFCEISKNTFSYRTPLVIASYVFYFFKYEVFKCRSIFYSRSIHYM